MWKTMELYKTLIGKRVNRDIFSSNGILLMPAGAEITYDHLVTLEKHGIILTRHDVAGDAPAPAAPFSHEAAIEEAVKHVSQVFDEIRETRKIPITDLRRDVIPMVHEAAISTNLIDLFASLQAKDDYTYRHNIAVGAISTLIGKWMGLDPKELMQLTTAALLHDAGKMLVPEEILNKPGKLTDEEYEIMKSHTVLGYNLLKETVGLNERQALVALQHHERLDGSGYPYGIKEDKIDLFSRIVMVADIYHAMTSPRVYRGASPFYEVLDQMDKDSFGTLDPQITRTFVHKIMNGLIGRTVVLTDDREGTIMLIHPHDPLRPLVKTGGDYIDLSKDSSVHIKKIH